MTPVISKSATTSKEERITYIKASSKRVQNWPESKQEAFYAAVARITGNVQNLHSALGGHVLDAQDMV
jgi:hypothetical protein